MTSRSRNHSTTQDRSRRRKAIIVIVAVAVVVAGWVVLITALAGNDGEGSSDSSGAQRNAQQAGTPEDGGGAGSEPGGGQPGSEGGSGGGSPADDSSSPGGPSEEELEEVADDALSPPPGGGAPDGEVPIEDEEGRSNGQRGFVSSFVGAAYGYTGEDPEEYRAGYESRIETGTYYDSAGADALQEYEALVEDGGAENAAILKDYRATSGEPLETEVDAAALEEFAPQEVMESEAPEGATVAEVTYAVGERYGDPSKDEDFGDVYGDVDYLKQRLFLSREEGSGWRLVAASAPEATEDPDADRPDPGANKVGEPSGAGGHGHSH